MNKKALKYFWLAINMGHRTRPTQGGILKSPGGLFQIAFLPWQKPLLGQTIVAIREAVTPYGKMLQQKAENH